jgi:hypothetical protein
VLEQSPLLQLAVRRDHQSAPGGCGPQSRGHRDPGSRERRLQAFGERRPGGRSPDGVGEQSGQHVFPAEEDLALIREVPEERGAVHSRAVCDLRDGRLLVAVLHEQVQGGVFQALTRIRCPSAHCHILSDAIGSHHLGDRCDLVASTW